MNNKGLFEKYLIFLLIIFSLLSTSIVYATDECSSFNDTSTISNVEDNDLLCKTYSVNGGKFSDIQKIIDKSKDGDIIKLSGTFKSEKKQINIDKKLTITSTDGAILDGCDNTRILNINSKTKGIVINNLVFINGNTDDDRKAGAINIYSDDITISNCEFMNNKGQVGAIYVSNTANDVKINDCIFEENYACYESNTGGMYGGAINTHSYNSKITNCYFLSNNAKGGGALNIYNKGTTVDSCTFMNNYASLHGGAIWMSTNATEVNIKNSLFTNNNADNNGGAIYALNNVNCNIYNCEFNFNYATRGGVIYSIAKTLTISECEFSDNYADFGGIINVNKGELTLTTSNLNSSIAENGGAIYSANSKINIKNTNFINNTADNGGAIYSNSYTNIYNTNFLNNNANNGGAIYTNSKEFIINTTQFNNNTADIGGAIYSNDYTNIYNSNFVNNNANNGGAIYANSPDFIISNTNFNNNTAINGSAIYNNNQLKIYNTEFRNNQANSYNITSQSTDSIKHREDIVIKITLIVGDNVYDAIYNIGYIIIDNTIPKSSNSAINQEILLEINNNTYVEYTDNEGVATFIIDSNDLEIGNHTYYFSHESPLYTFIVNNNTINIEENPTENTENILQTTKTTPKKYTSKKSNKKITSKTNKKTKKITIPRSTVFDRENKLQSYMRSKVNQKVNDIATYSDGNLIKALDYKILRIPGYKEQ